jgi:hypothetical protein
MSTKCYVCESTENREGYSGLYQLSFPQGHLRPTAYFCCLECLQDAVNHWTWLPGINEGIQLPIAETYPRYIKNPLVNING